MSGAGWKEREKGEGLVVICPNQHPHHPVPRARIGREENEEEWSDESDRNKGLQMPIAELASWITPSRFRVVWRESCERSENRCERSEQSQPPITAFLKNATKLLAFFFEQSPSILSSLVEKKERSDVDRQMNPRSSAPRDEREEKSFLPVDVNEATRVTRKNTSTPPHTRKGSEKYERGVPIIELLNLVAKDRRRRERVPSVQCSNSGCQLYLQIHRALWLAREARRMTTAAGKRCVLEFERKANESKEKDMRQHVSVGINSCEDSYAQRKSPNTDEPRSAAVTCSPGERPSLQSKSEETTTTSVHSTVKRRYISSATFP